MKYLAHNIFFKAEQKYWMCTTIKIMQIMFILEKPEAKSPKEYSPKE